ncbi:MAG: hypothetical protein KBT06_00610 [Prevotellaceae bacterium]|nr:hypothetical protein [Candidatus Colivivens equi]
MNNSQVGIVLGQIGTAEIEASLIQRGIISGELSTPRSIGEGDKHYEHNQRTASAVWNIVHNLKKYPAVFVVDSGGSVVIGEVDYIDEDSLTITFTAPFAGKAYCN